MEIKITISDTGAGAGESSAVGGQQIAPPPEILRAAMGAIDAGPAPNSGGSTQFGVPPPFSSGNALGDITTSPGTSAGPSAAAMSVSGSVVESVVDPGGERK